MGGSRMAAASALIARAMGGRDTRALVRVTAGEPRRALLEAARADRDQPAVAGGGVGSAHPSWFTGPLLDLHPTMRASLLALAPPDVARLAALALERFTGEPLEDPGADPPRGLTAVRMAAALRPPLGPPPPFLDDRSARDPLGWLDQARLPVEEVFSRWPVEAKRLEGTLDAPLVALAACLAGRSDEARGFAVLLDWRTGRTFLAARSCWALLLDPDDAAELRTRLEDTHGSEP